MNRSVPIRWTVALVAALVAVAPALAADKLPNVVVLATGGTIAGAQAEEGGYGYKSGSFDIKDLISAVPNLDKLAVITGEQVVNIGSQDMNNEVWLTLARRLAEVVAEDPEQRRLAGRVAGDGVEVGADHGRV